MIYSTIMENGSAKFLVICNNMDSKKRYVHGRSLNLAEMSTLVTEFVRCCPQVTQLDRDE